MKNDICHCCHRGSCLQFANFSCNYCDLKRACLLSQSFTFDATIIVLASPNMLATSFCDTYSHSTVWVSYYSTHKAHRLGQAKQLLGLCTPLPLEEHILERTNVLLVLCTASVTTVLVFLLSRRSLPSPGYSMWNPCGIHGIHLEFHVESMESTLAGASAVFLFHSHHGFHVE